MLYLFSMIKKSQTNNLATKKDIQGIRTEFRQTEKSLRREILKVEARTERVEEKVDILDKKLDRIENKIDGFVGVVDNLKKDNEVGADQYREHDVKIKDHEQRLTALESATT